MSENIYGRCDASNISQTLIDGAQALLYNEVIKMG
mgnify:FL=1